MGRIYLDYAATAPLRPAARAAMLEALERTGNPSSVHQHGQAARHALDSARRHMADNLGVRAERVVFTSGGTEANNLALRGIMVKAQGKTLLISALEHDCVRTTAHALQVAGLCNLEEIPADNTGIINLSWLQQRLQQGGVALVSIMHANNETGVLQPVAEAASLTHSAGALFHTDAVQTVGHMVVQPDTLAADLLSFSAHKFGGPQGAGALVVKPELPMEALMTGGAQERNRRAGTENLAGICGMAAALSEAMQNVQTETAAALQLATILEKHLPSSCQLVAPTSPKVPHMRQLLTPGRKGEEMVMKLDLAGIAASQGSACSSGRVQASHVLKAMGYTEQHAGEGLRLSWGWASRPADIEAALKLL